MTRDAFDVINPRTRERFGDNERIRGNDSVRSDLVDLTLELKMNDPGHRAIAVVDPAKPPGKWIWLPNSQIAFVFKDKAKWIVEVTLPTWLARDKGLL